MSYAVFRLDYIEKHLEDYLNSPMNTLIEMLHKKNELIRNINLNRHNINLCVGAPNGIKGESQQHRDSFSMLPVNLVVSCSAPLPSFQYAAVKLLKPSYTFCRRLFPLAILFHEYKLPLQFPNSNCPTLVTGIQQQS